MRKNESQTRILIPKFSVLMCVYINETASNLKQSIESILNQTILPNELVIIEDGPLTIELQAVLDEYIKNDYLKIRRYKLEKNIGLGLALRYGVDKCRFEYVARMDSDDIAQSNRFEEQMYYLAKFQDVDIIGSNIVEFIGSPDNIISTRVMPETHNAISKSSRRRNPFAHPSVVFRKSLVQEVGSYHNAHLHEDYDLWVRMIQKNAKCYNIQKPLVYMRTSEDFYSRRGGLKYALSITNFKAKLFHSGYISTLDFAISAGSSLIVGVLPGSLRKRIYRKLLRGRG